MQSMRIHLDATPSVRLIVLVQLMKWALEKHVKGSMLSLDTMASGERSASRQSSSNI